MTKKRNKLKGLAALVGLALLGRATFDYYKKHLDIKPVINGVNESNEIGLDNNITLDGNLLDAGENRYRDFRYPDELEDILKHARRIGAEPELLMAIRCAENGDKFAYGIMPAGKMLERYKQDAGYELNGTFHLYKDEKEKQLCWAAWTVKMNEERFPRNGNRDFISYLAGRYAPFNAKNDPLALNKNWERNVRFFYEKFKNSSR